MAAARWSIVQDGEAMKSTFYSDSKGWFGPRGLRVATPLLRGSSAVPPAVSSAAWRPGRPLASGGERCQLHLLTECQVKCLLPIPTERAWPELPGLTPVAPPHRHAPEQLRHSPRPPQGGELPGPLGHNERRSMCVLTGSRFLLLTNASSKATKTVTLAGTSTTSQPSDG